MTTLRARIVTLPPLLRDLVALLCDLSDSEIAHLMAALPHNVGSIEVHFDRDRIKLLPRAKAAERSRAMLQQSLSMRP